GAGRPGGRRPSPPRAGRDRSTGREPHARLGRRRAGSSAPARWTGAPRPSARGRRLRGRGRPQDPARAPAPRGAQGPSRLTRSVGQGGGGGSSPHLGRRTPVAQITNATETINPRRGSRGGG